MGTSGMARSPGTPFPGAGPGPSRSDQRMAEKEGKKREETELLLTSKLVVVLMMIRVATRGGRMMTGRNKWRGHYRLLCVGPTLERTGEG